MAPSNGLPDPRPVLSVPLPEKEQREGVLVGPPPRSTSYVNIHTSTVCGVFPLLPLRSKCLQRVPADTYDNIHMAPQPPASARVFGFANDWCEAR